jgi:2-polyprenyl-6-methoxyphenol hydroxylase-like FAD-dependent oxidoreductase
MRKILYGNVLAICVLSVLCAVSCKIEQGNPANPRILIVGGGIGGLALANALKKEDIAFDLIEKRKIWKHEGAGLGLPANAVWALERLGFDQEIKSNTRHIQSMIFKTDQDEFLIKEDLSEIHNATAQFRSVHRADLHALLFDKVKDSNIIMGQDVKRITQDADSCEVEFIDGTIKHYDLIVGADGLHSRVRQLVFGEIPFTYQGAVVWRSVINTPKDLEHPIYMFGEKSVFLFYPISNNQTYIAGLYYDQDRPVDIPELRLTKFKELFGNYKGLVPQALEQLKSPEQLIYGYLDSLSKITWAKGNVVLIGDASHACSPMLQQGGALAIEDALVLAQELSKGQRQRISLSGILDNYVQRRKPRVEWVVQKSDAKIKILPQQRNEIIKQKGAPNVALFRLLMKENP